MESAIPVFPNQFLGAFGDLPPLAHLSLPLLGYGEFWDEDGTGTLPAVTVLSSMNLEPFDLQAKDGLSLIIGTQLMSVYGAFILEK